LRQPPLLCAYKNQQKIAQNGTLYRLIIEKTLQSFLAANFLRVIFAGSEMAFCKKLKKNKKLSTFSLRGPLIPDSASKEARHLRHHAAQIDPDAGERWPGSAERIRSSRSREQSVYFNVQLR